MSLSSKYKGISHSDTKLVIDAFSNLFSGIKTTIVIFITLEIFFGVNLPFFLAISVVDEFNMMPAALNYSELNCSRINDLVTCSREHLTLANSQFY